MAAVKRRTGSRGRRLSSPAEIKLATVMPLCPIIHDVPAVSRLRTLGASGRERAVAEIVVQTRIENFMNNLDILYLNLNLKFRFEFKFESKSKFKFN